MVGPSFFRMTVFLLRSNVREAIESTRRTEPRNSPRDHTGGETFHRLYDTHCSILENIFLRMNTMVQGRKAPRTFLSEVLLVPYHACSIRSIRPFHTWFCLFLCDPISYSLFSLSLSLIVVTQIRGQIAGSFPLFPLLCVALDIYRIKTSAHFPLVDSRRNSPTHARTSQHLLPLSFFSQNIFTISPR